MRKIKKEDYCELAVFLMDYYGWSRGYRLLCKLDPRNFSSNFCEELRQTETYKYLVEKYQNKV